MLLGGGRLGGVRDAVGRDGRADDRAVHAGRHARCARAGLGHRLVVFRRIAASCFPSDRSDTPASPARRCGSIRRRSSYVVFLSNRVHPDGKGDVNALRGRVATVAAAALLTPDDVRAGVARGFSASARDQSQRATADAPKRAEREGGQPRAPVLAGIDVLEADGFASLRGRRVGLLTNQTGRSRQGVSTIDLLMKAKDVTLVSLFSPEHGIRGQVDERVFFFF